MVSILLIWLVLLLINVGSLLAGHTVVSPAVSFAAYTDSLLGRPQSKLQTFETRCHWAMEYTRREEYCRLTPATGVLSHVDVFVQEGMIHRLEFTVSDNALRLGDLMLMWGEPTEIIRYRGVLLFKWGDTIDVRTRYTEYPSPLLSVVSVYITTPSTQPSSPSKDT